VVANINRLSVRVSGRSAENADWRSARGGGSSIITGTEVVESENYV